jgi:type IV pilus assembly protein PilW
LIENIEELEFYYTLEDGTQTTTPTAAQFEKIRTVQINILVRADQPDEEFTYNYTYTTDAGTNWGPYNDNLRRRLLTTTVQFRNLGLFSFVTLASSSYSFRLQWRRYDHISQK